MRINTLYSTKEIQTEQGQPMELRYYLIQDVGSRIHFGQKFRAEDATEDSTKGFTEHEAMTDRITYGIRIVKTQEGQQEQECLAGLSASMEAVERLLKQMIHDLVTPMTAMYVVDDWAAMDH